MTTRHIGVHLQSFVLTVFMLIGNAEAFGLDLGITILLPTLIFLRFLEPTTSYRYPDHRRIFAVTALALITIRSAYIEIPYFDLYYLWPLKAALVVVLVDDNNYQWPLFNTFLLFLFCLFLFVASSVEDGRLYSLFGPNMLYRMFGLLLAFSVILLLEVKRNNLRILLIFVIIFSTYVQLLTGSIGAIVILALMPLLFALRLSRRLLFIVVPIILAFLLISESLTDYLSSFQSNTFVSFHRLALKSSTLDSNERLDAWRQILDHPITIFGSNYDQYAEVWSFDLPYPHNVFVELWAFYGLLGIPIIFYLLKAVIRLRVLSFRTDALGVTYLILFIGALFSGDLSDNFGVVGLGVVMSLRIFSRRYLRKTI